MPSISARQHRAMEAAMHGRSTLGIPAKVGQEFVQADQNALVKPITKRRNVNALAGLLSPRQ